LCWIFHAEHVSAAFGINALAIAAPKISQCFSIVVPDLKFGNVQRHIFGTDFLERADSAAFKDRTESLNYIA
jgi:hypothetical protein